MKMTQEEYKSFDSENAGYCAHCDAVTTDEVEPDAQGYECPECGNHEVMGIENALVYEHIEISDEEEDEDQTDIISFSDEE